jgi:hypothetical protein
MTRRLAEYHVHAQPFFATHEALAARLDTTVAHVRRDDSQSLKVPREDVA